MYSFYLDSDYPKPLPVLQKHRFLGTPPGEGIFPHLPLTNRKWTEKRTGHLFHCNIRLHALYWVYRQIRLGEVTHVPFVLHRVSWRYA